MTCDWTTIDRPSTGLALVGWLRCEGRRDGRCEDERLGERTRPVWFGEDRSPPLLETADKPRNFFITLRLEAILKPNHPQAIDLSSSRSIFDRIDLLYHCLGRSGFSDLGFVAWKDGGDTIAFSSTSSSAIQVVFCSVRESRLLSQFFRWVVLPETMIPSFLILDFFKDTSLLVYCW